MQNLSLNFYQRIMLWQLVGAYPAPSLKEASVYLRIIEKLRLTDSEMMATQFMQDQGRFSWRLPEAGYGDRVVERENEEAKALLTAMEAPAPVRVSDADWMLKVVDELKTVPTGVTASDGVLST
jgi:hypothetical protein